jgi:hypothetical protein
MSKRIVQYVSSISVNQDVGRIQFRLEDNTTHDANNLPVVRLAALVAALEATRNVYFNKDNSGMIWIATDPEAPGPQ